MADLRALLLIAWSAMRRKRVTLLSFAGAVAFFQWLVAASFPAIGGLEAVNSVVGTFPDGLRQLLKIAPNLQAGFGLADYLALSWFHPVFLGLGSAFVVSRATDALAREVEGGGAYLLLSRPLPRWALVGGKALELVVGAGILSAAGWVGLWAGVAMLPEVTLPLGRYGLVALMAWALFAALGAGALVISASTGRAAVAGGVGTAWTLLAFVLDVIPAVFNSPVAWLNPWHHYFPQEIVATGALPWGGVLVLVGWVAAGCIGAAVIFGRRDLV